ncbi:hypothetical protein D3C77_384910 [compost metagenome]
MPGHKRLQHVKTDIRQGATQDRPQHILQRPVDRPFAEHVLAPAEGHGHQGFFAGQAALVVEALAAIADTGHQHPVDPAFEDGRGREPEDREVQHHQICPQQLVQFALDIRGNRAALDPQALLQGIDQVLGILPRGKVIGTGHRVPVHRIQVADLHLMALGLEGFHSCVTQGSGEGLRLGMSVNDQYIHQGFP